jgi:hypothetical protein
MQTSRLAIKTTKFSSKGQCGGGLSQKFTIVLVVGGYVQNNPSPHWPLYDHFMALIEGF